MTGMHVTDSETVGKSKNHLRNGVAVVSFCQEVGLRHEFRTTSLGSAGTAAVPEG